MSDENRDLVRRHFDEIWSQRNLAVCDEIMAEDYVEHAVAPFAQSESGAVNGTEHMRGVVEKLVEHWATRDDLSAMLQLGLVPSPGGPPS